MPDITFTWQPFTIMLFGTLGVAYLSYWVDRIKKGR